MIDLLTLEFQQSPMNGKPTFTSVSSNFPCQYTRLISKAHAECGSETLTHLANCEQGYQISN